MTRIITEEVPPIPGTPGSNNFFNVLKTCFFTMLPFFTPALLAIMKISCDREKQRLRQEFEMFAQMDRDVKRCFLLVQENKQAGKRDSDWKKIILTLHNKEEATAKEQLKALSSIENNIKQYLDIRCSPFKFKENRDDIAHNIHKIIFSPLLSSLNMYDGITEIFNYDPIFCGGGIEKNGRLYRVWMLYWQSKIQAEKYKNVLKNLENALEHEEAFLKSHKY